MLLPNPEMRMLMVTISPFEKGGSRGIFGGRIAMNAWLRKIDVASYYNHRKSPSVPLFQRGKCLAVCAAMFENLRCAIRLLLEPKLLTQDL